MHFLNCPRCGLSVRSRTDHADHEASATCPRCAGQTGLRVPMYATERPRPPVSPAVGDGSPPRPEPQPA